MPIIEGNTSGSIASIAFDIPATIISGYLVNKTGSSIVVNLYVATGTGDRSIVPLNLTLISGVMYILEEQVLLKPGYYLIITTNGSLDYYFSIQ